MGYVKEKYTNTYFLKKDNKGCPTEFGVNGAELFNEGKGEIRDMDRNILERINFKDKVIVDFGFGRGEALKYAFEMKAKKIIGVDFSKAAFKIAKNYLAYNKCEAEIFCSDALKFVDDQIKENKNKYDVVLMLDFIEHIPRDELSQLLIKLKLLLAPKAILVINTPVFPIDNDVIIEGLKREALDTSDLYPETIGMHCNRYTKESLEKYLREIGYINIDGHIFCDKKSYVKKNIKNKAQKIIEFINKGYPLSLIKYSPNIYEYVSIPTDIKDKLANMYFPVWHKIRKGILKNRQFLIDYKDGLWQKEIINGDFDHFFWEELKKYNLKDKIVLDIGAHIGYHTMSFASLVGKNGHVYAFEPNEFNIERMELNLSRNEDLKKRVIICNCAISNSNSPIDFYFSPQIDNGFSSGSFVHGALTPYSQEEYNAIGFKHKKVSAFTLDKVLQHYKVKRKPDFIKIDIEGAENIALEGATNTIKKYRPIFLIELHSFVNIIKASEFFLENSYEFEFLNYESEHRSFILAKYIDTDSLRNTMKIIRKINEISIKVFGNYQNKITELERLLKVNNEKHEEKKLGLMTQLNRLSNVSKEREIELNKLKKELSQLNNSRTVRLSRRIQNSAILGSVINEVKKIIK